MRLHLGIITACFLLLVLNCLSFVTPVSLEEDLSINLDEKLVLDKFKNLVVSTLPHDYMREDIYLIRWLRARNFDIQKAEKMLMDSLKWREKNKMDTILEEDWSDMEKEYKYYINAFSYDGKPVAYFELGQMDIRKIALSGKLDRASRYLDRYLEQITTLIRKQRKDGKNVTQYDFITNMEGQNLIQHGCLQCIPFYIRFINTYENHYPGAADKMYFINTNSLFELVLQSVRSAMSSRTRRAIEIFGTNRIQWQNAIFKEIPKEELPIQIGGDSIYDD